jgi:hypothetical protein
MTSGKRDATPSVRGGRWALGPGARRGLAAAVIAGVLAVVLVVVLSPGHSGANSTYGSLPTWLPKAARQIDKNPAPAVEAATPTRPILEEQQGYPVRVQLPTGTAEVTVTGPEFPGWVTTYAQRGLWPSTKLVPSTFIATFTEVTGTVPLDARAFTGLTSTGTITRARLRASGAGAVPAAVHAGQTLTLHITTSTVEGQGSIRWSPLSSKVLAAWMYQLELD